MWRVDAHKDKRWEYLCDNTAFCIQVFVFLGGAQTYDHALVSLITVLIRGCLFCFRVKISGVVEDGDSSVIAAIGGAREVHVSKILA